MCGIITIVKREDDNIPTKTSILGMLTGQQHRGTQGFGYVAFNEMIEGYVRRETRDDIEKPLDKCTARSIMFHHRLPTSTPNYADCNHPIKVSHKELTYDYYVIHNGMISNHSVLHDKHAELGYKYMTTIVTSVETENHISKTEKWNDSEAFAVDISRFIEGKQETIESKGSIAFVALQVHKKNNKVLGVYFGRNTNPLTINISDKCLVLRSEGEKIDIERDVLYRLDLKTWKVDEAEAKIGEVFSTTYNNNHRGNYGTYNNDYPDYDNDDNAYANCRKLLPEPRNQHDISKKDAVAEQMIIDSWVNTELRKIDAEIERLDEVMIALIESRAYYQDSGDDAQVVEMSAEITKIERQIDDLESDRETILDENVGVGVR